MTDLSFANLEALARDSYEGYLIRTRDDGPDWGELGEAAAARWRDAAYELNKALSKLEGPQEKAVVETVRNLIGALSMPAPEVPDPNKPQLPPISRWSWRR